MSIPMRLFDENEVPHPVATLGDNLLKQHYISIIALIRATEKHDYLMQMLMLTLIAEDIGLSEEHKEQAVRTASDNDKMNDALKVWREHQLRDVLLYDMCYIAAVDGNIYDHDREYLQLLADKLDIPRRKCEALIQIALTLRFSRGDHDLAWFDKTLSQAGLDPEQFGFIRSRFQGIDVL